MSIYFSATGNTAKIAKVIKEQLKALDVEVKDYDITSYSDRLKPLDLTPYDAVIFGFPVYANKAPHVVREWLTTLNGMGKKCSMFFTYGGVFVDRVHSSTRQILERQNFEVVSSAEFLGAHSFNVAGWNLIKTRPNASDFMIAQEYASRTYKRLKGEDPSSFDLFKSLPEVESQPKPATKSKSPDFRHYPTREGQECSMCRTCENLCPSGAMNADTGTVSGDFCMLCFRCITNCPDQVLQIEDLRSIWQNISARTGLTEEIIEKKVSKIYL
ncbi:MAG: EFR1 family ferrodoxin [Candidatus Hermodarchaeota archaeon]